MQETSPVSPQSEITPLIPANEITPQVETGEKPKILRIYQKAFARFEEVFDRKRADGTLTEAERVGFVVTNIEHHNSNSGEKVSVQSFKDSEGNRKSIRRNVPLNHILAQLDSDIDAATDETVKKELQADKEYLMENSRPLLRNDNRVELLDRIIERRAVLIARAMTGSDSDAALFMDQAKSAIENERELIVPNPQVRADITDTMVKEKTTDTVITQMDAALPPVVERIQPRKLSGQHVRSRARTPIDEARKAILENRKLEVLKKQQNYEAQRVTSENKAAIVRGQLSDARTGILGTNLHVTDRIAAMNEQVATMNEAVRNIAEPLSTVTPEQTVVHSFDVKKTVPMMAQIENTAEVTEEVSDVDLLDPLTLGDIAGEHPEEFIENEEPLLVDATQSEETSTAEIQTVQPEPEKPVVSEQPINATSLILRNTVPAEAPQATNEPVNFQAYREAHTQNSVSEIPSSIQTPVVAPKISFWGRLANSLGFTNKAA
jgi:hypothetical protein